ncbi:MULTISPECIES: aldo/keto reductase [Rhodopseudomonas]|uniref:2,5-diketo-D-gluconic acid reductase n=1 Tax=Rhodopseudomonas palustris TaxID=1076 RepID=A0A0D7F3S7_RHOPL|nr:MULTISPECIES: aldo/keto reductase [Rhodopseudomonas]KIZ47471.1 2,5-diketo-D-gluconic acid reductase [Rhodopseudomonas palustris]MDF3809444.1 aldo/keto reductase [Rhodopseudomonas sp. BAL398]WOK15482.1 aldo/keto reductase [Rhodopseudomonas sp. BAL398]
MTTLTTQGLSVPKLGLGTFRMQGDDCRAAVESALALGYRHIDTAEMYGNEDAVGDAVAGSGIARDQIHITTKVWWQNLAPDAIRKAFDTSIAKLKTPYVDFYLIHWPAPQMDLAAALETLMRIKQEGGARAIGVCNFPVALLKQAVEEIQAPIACNQVEYHVLLGQTRLLTYARSKNVPLTAYAPLAQGRLAKYPQLQTIAAKHGATAAQVALAWLLDQDGVMAIPKARSEASQKSNLGARDVTLDDADRATIAGLPKDQRFVNPGFAPEWDPE